MRIKQLIRGLPITIKTAKDVLITGLCEDSRKILPGHLFIARKGARFDGNKMIPHAVKNGACAILTDIYDPFIPVAQLITEKVEEVVPKLAARYYHNPSKQLQVIGITGTNGKTTTSYILRHLLEGLSVPLGLLGTIEKWRKGCYVPAKLTTDDIVTNQQHLSEMVAHKKRAAIMEVSSHALAQKRVEGIAFHGAIFTNLSQDHMDYHHTMEEYASVKKQLFLSHGARFSIINQDDPYASFMKKGLTSSIITYGIDQGADVMAIPIESTLSGSKFLVSYQRQKVEMHLPLIGRFNIYNALAAMSYCLACGHCLEKMGELLLSFRGVPGRMEQVAKRVFVDFAHTPDGLERTLRALRALTKEPIVVVFGCGGNRDQSKRALMAKIAERYADRVIVTSDNPRLEDPEAIIQEIVQGFSQKGHKIYKDRKEAIWKGAAQIKQEGILLIAGKGHEKTQEFAHKTLPFDDVAIAKEAIRS